MSVPDRVEILLVEDNAADAELTIRSLRRSGLAERLHHVRDGVEALDFLLGTGPHADRAGDPPPRVILLDIKLPRLDGIEVLRCIKSYERLRSTPVVMLTSSREETDVLHSYRLGANSYVPKPVDFDRFAQVVRDLGLYWLGINEPPRRRGVSP